LFKLVQDYLANVTPQYWQFWLGLALVMMIMFGRVYGAIIAAVIFGICTVLKLPFLHSIVFTVALVLVLGIARPHLLPYSVKMTQRANALQRRVKERFARKPGGARAPGA
jgi:hypothetical protein